MMNCDDLLLVETLRIRHCIRPVMSLAETCFLLRANQNVRAKERAVNSVFLVQLRKMFATDFRGWTRIKNFFKNVWLSRAEGADSFCGRELGEKFGRRRRLIVHRGCTGNAERQWSVASGQSWLEALRRTIQFVERMP